MEKYLLFLEKRRMLVIVLVLIFFILSASGMYFLRFSTDFRVYLGSEHEDVMRLEIIDNKFTKNETIYIALENENRDIFNPKILSIIKNLTEELWKTPHSRRVDSISNYQYSYSKSDEIIVENLINDPSKYNKADLRNLENIALTEPFLRDFLVSSDGKVTAIQVTLSLSDSLKERMIQTPESVSFVRGIISKYENKNPDLKFYIAGSVMMNHVMGEAAIKDILTLIPLCYAAIILLMYMLLRNFYGVVITMSIVTLTNGFTLGLTGWTSPVLAPVIGFVPNAILIIAIADCIHILSSFFSNLSKGVEKNEAVRLAVRSNVSAVILTTITTIVGFMCLNFNESPPYRDLGNMVALGALFACILSLTLLPSLLFMLSFKERVSPPAFNIIVPKIGRHVLDNSKFYLILNVMLIGFLTIEMFDNELNDNWNNYFDRSFDLRVSSDKINEDITGLHRIDYEVKDNFNKSITDYQYLLFLEKFTVWLRNQPEVKYVSSVSDVIKRLNKNMHNDDHKYYKIPSSDDLSAQYLLFYEMSLPYGLDLNNQVSFDKKSSRITVMMGKTTSEEVLEFADKVENWLHLNNKNNASVSKAAGIDVAFANIARSNSKSMIIGTFLAFILVSILIGLIGQSTKYGLISIIPNIFPAMCAFGIWALTVQQIGLATSAVVSMAIGIIVDDTVHFLSKYRQMRKDTNLSVREALLKTYSTVGVAIIITSIILIVGFLILGMSPFEPTSQMGNLLALTIASALVIDLTLLPCVLLIIDRKKVQYHNQNGI